MKKITPEEIKKFISKPLANEKVLLKKDPLYPKISIITPSYNQGQFLERTIVSVLNQNYPNLEYIIIDGGSADGSVDIIKKYGKYLTYWVSEKDKGQSDAIKKGFSKATGEILAWLNSDDIYFSDTLLKVAKVFSENKNIDVVYSNMYIINNYDRITGERHLIPWIPVLSKLGTLYGGYGGVYQPASFWKKELYNKVGGLDTEFKFCMDNDLFIRFVLANAKFKYLNEFLAGFRVHEKSKTSTIQDIARKEIKLVFEKNCINRKFSFIYSIIFSLFKFIIHLFQGNGLWYMRIVSNKILKRSSVSY